jgi:UPF0176 protein
MNSSRVAILSFYSFVNISNPEILLPKILLVGKKKLLKGTILIATEGVNGSVSGSYENVKLLVDEIIKLTAADEVNVKINYSDKHPFQKLKVKIKPEIIAMNVGELDVHSLKGKYVEPRDWDQFICLDDVITIDTRNDYEVVVGSFNGAIDPKTATFKEFPEWVDKNISLLADKKIAMYCTGGIRCEKSTAYLQRLGFNEVYHLKGGILQYLEDTQNKNNLWQGECFVFDDRRMVASDLTPAEGSWLERDK